MQIVLSGIPWFMSWQIDSIDTDQLLFIWGANAKFEGT